MINKTNLDNEQWLNKLKERVNSHVEPLPKMDWEELEKELTPKKRFILVPRQLKNIAAAAALLIALFGVSLYFTHSPISDEVANIDTPSMNYIQDLPILENQVQSDKFIEKELAEVSLVSKKKMIAKADIINENCDELVMPNSIETQTIEEKNLDTTSTTRKKSEEVNNEKNNNPTKSHPSSKDKYHLPVTKSKKSDSNSWSVGASVNGSGLLAQNESSTNFNDYRITNNIHNSEVGETSYNQTIFFKDGIAYVYNENDIINTKHHQPITVGISVRKLLKHNLSIESGVNFTHLSSDITFAENFSKQVKQKLNYIGIPVKLNWSFVNSKYFTLYASAGGQVEKCIQGKIDGNNISSKPWQFSVLGGVGAQFNISKHVGIYAEPGIAYFFNNNSNIQTIRKEHPFNFNMQGGIRLTY